MGCTRVATGQHAASSNLTLEVDVVEYLGTESQVVGHMNTPFGQRVSVMLPGDAHSQLHSRIDLEFSVEDLHVFDSVTGLSLRP